MAEAVMSIFLPIGVLAVAAITTTLLLIALDKIRV